MQMYKSAYFSERDADACVTFFTCPCEPFLDLGKWICLQNFAQFFQHLEDVQDGYHEGREADSQQFLHVF